MMRKLLLSAAALAMLTAACRAQSNDGLPHKPNILVLMLDDQDDLTSPYWEAMPQTDSMVHGGVHFVNMFGPTPICSPGAARFSQGGSPTTRASSRLWARRAGGCSGQRSTPSSRSALNQLGYINAHFGKTWGETQPNPGWQRWCALGGDNMYTGYDYTVTDYWAGGNVANYKSQQYSTDFLSQKAVQFLQSQAGSNQPFFLYLAPTAPHLPLPPPQRYAAYAQRRWGKALPERPNYNEKDISDKSSWLRAQGAVRSAAVPYASMEYHKRMGSLMAVDDMMTAVREELIAQGKWQNTIIVFTSDNGYNLGATG